MKDVFSQSPAAGYFCFHKDNKLEDVMLQNVGSAHVQIIQLYVEAIYAICSTFDTFWLPTIHNPWSTMFTQ